MSFYRLLLKDPAGDHEKLSAAECSDRMNEIACDIVIPLLGGTSVAPTLAVDDQIAGDAGDCLPIEDMVPTLAVEDQIDDDGGVSIGGDEGESATGWPSALFGRTLVYETRKVGSARIVDGLRITCTRHGIACKRFRAMHMWTDQLGPKAPLYYLACWLAGAADRTFEEHKWKPTLSEVRAFMSTPDCP